MLNLGDRVQVKPEVLKRMGLVSEIGVSRAIVAVERFNDPEGLLSPTYRLEGFPVPDIGFTEDSLSLDAAWVVRGVSSEPTIKDSGDRTEYSTGAVRDRKEGKGRCDLMPPDVLAEISGDKVFTCINDFYWTGETRPLALALQSFADKRYSDVEGCRRYATMLLEVSKHFEEGAQKYGEHNWQKGIPIHSYIDSAIRHYLKYRAGWTDEPHDRAFVWNVICCIWTMSNKPEMDDWTYKPTAEEGENDESED